MSRNDNENDKNEKKNNNNNKHNNNKNDTSNTSDKIRRTGKIRLAASSIRNSRGCVFYLKLLSASESSFSYGFVDLQWPWAQCFIKRCFSPRSRRSAAAVTIWLYQKSIFPTERIFSPQSRSFVAAVAVWFYQVTFRRGSKAHRSAIRLFSSLREKGNLAPRITVIFLSELSLPSHSFISHWEFHTNGMSVRWSVWMYVKLSLFSLLGTIYGCVSGLVFSRNEATIRGRVSPSVHPSIRPLVRVSVRPLVTPLLYYF